MEKARRMRGIDHSTLVVDTRSRSSAARKGTGRDVGADVGILMQS